jgi:type II secretory pathway component HofQ
VQSRAFLRDCAISCNKLLSHKDLMMLGPPWWVRALPLALALWAVPASAVFAQAATPGLGDLTVTRLQGAGPDAAGPPRQSPQPRPDDNSALPLTQFDDRAQNADLDGPRRIALSVARPLPLQDMLLLLVNGTPFSIVTDQAVDGTFIGDLKNLTMREALEAVLFPRGLDYDVQGRLIRVFAHKPSTRLFDVNFVNQRREWRRGVRTAMGAGANGVPSAELVTTGESDRFEELARGVRSLLSDSGRMHIDRSAGMVQVTDSSERLDQVAVYVEAVQLRANRQVRIEARVLEVALSDATAMSIDWKAAGARGGAVGGVHTAGVRIADPTAFIRAIGEQGTVTLIAAPQVLALNNQPVMMRVGAENVYFEPASSVEQNGRTVRTSAPATLLDGLTLMVTAQIAGDGAVQLSVAPTYAEKMGEAKSAAGELYPVLRVSEADTLMRVQDGDTVVLSGFMRDRSIAKPRTGLASYFGSQSRQTARSELVILLTPVVVTPGSGIVATTAR